MENCGWPSANLHLLSKVTNPVPCSCVGNVAAHGMKEQGRLKHEFVWLHCKLRTFSLLLFFWQSGCRQINQDWNLTRTTTSRMPCIKSVGMFFFFFHAIMLCTDGIHGTNTVKFHFLFHLLNQDRNQFLTGNAHETSGKLIQCYINYSSMWKNILAWWINVIFLKYVVPKMGNLLESVW